MARFRLVFLLVSVLAGSTSLLGCHHAASPAGEAAQGGANGLRQRSAAEQQRFGGGSPPPGAVNR